MRVNLKYILPFGEVAPASALFGWSASWRPVGCDAYGGSPAWILLISINQPAAVLRNLYYRPGSWSGVTGFVMDGAILIALSGILWYWVARNIASWRLAKTVLMFRWLPLRIGGDGLFIAVGLSCGYWVLSDPSWSPHLHGYSCYKPLALSQWMAFVSFGLQIVWTLALIYLYGRDILYCALRIETRPPLA